jgi:hypothetical protein
VLLKFGEWDEATAAVMLDLPADATKEQMQLAIEIWEASGNVAGGPLVDALWRYWRGEGPRLDSARSEGEFERVRRIMEPPSAP